MSNTAKITEAPRLLKKREGEIAEGKLPGVYFDKVTFDALAKDLVTDYTVKGRDTLKRVKWSIDCLKESSVTGALRLNMNVCEMDETEPFSPACPLGVPCT